MSDAQPVTDVHWSSPMDETRADLAQAVTEHPTMRANGQPLVLRCKYGGEACPTFNDPRSLGMHYREQHPNEQRTGADGRDRMQCLLCAKVVSRAGRASHMAAAHRTTPRSQMSASFVRVGTEGLPPPRVLVGKGSRPCPLACGATVKDVRKHLRNVHQQREPELTRLTKLAPRALAVVEPEPKHTPAQRAEVHNDATPPIDAAFIVQSVIGAIVHPDGSVPVEHLEHIFTWREATATMLRAITREN